MILNAWRCDELEAEQVSIRADFGPHDFGVLDRLMVRRRSNAKRAHLTDGHTHVDRDPQAADARIDRQARAAHGAEQVDLRIERPPPRPTARPTMHGSVSAIVAIISKQLVERHGGPHPWVFLPGLALAIILQDLDTAFGSRIVETGFGLAIAVFLFFTHRSNIKAMLK